MIAFIGHKLRQGQSEYVRMRPVPLAYVPDTYCPLWIRPFTKGTVRIRYVYQRYRTYSDVFGLSPTYFMPNMCNHFQGILRDLAGLTLYRIFFCTMWSILLLIKKLFARLVQKTCSKNLCQKLVPKTCFKNFWDKRSIETAWFALQSSQTQNHGFQAQWFSSYRADCAV